MINKNLMGENCAGFSISEETNLKQFYELSYIFYMGELEKIARSRFLYSNVPDGVDVRFLEYALFIDGMATLFFDDNMGKFVGVKAITQSGFNEYGLPYRFIGKGYNEFNEERNLDNAILILNNELMRGDFPTVQRYAHILANFDTTLMLNSTTLRKPYMFLGDKKSESSIKIIWKKILSFEPLFLSNKSYNADNIQVLDLLKGGNHFLKDVYDIKTNYFNEFLTHMGISNMNQQKKERMLSDEVNRSMGGSLAFRNSPYECRVRGLKEFNDMYGENMQVEFNESITNIIDDVRQQVVGNNLNVSYESLGGFSNEQIYN